MNYDDYYAIACMLYWWAVCMVFGLLIALMWVIVQVSGSVSCGLVGLGC